MIMTAVRPGAAIRLAASVLLAGTLSAACTGSSETSATVDSLQQDAAEATYLFVHTAPAMTYEDGVLVLEGVNDMTLYFTDRPERIAGWMSSAEFVDEWGVGDNSFASVPPNADLSILTEEAALEIVVVLRNPRLIADDLVYDVEVLQGEIPARAGPSSLFIDVIGRPMSPVSVAGVARRTRRRTVRRVTP